MKLEETAYSLAGDFADLSKFFSISEEPQNRWSWGHQLFFLGSQGICWFVAAGLLVCIDVDGGNGFFITMAGRWPCNGDHIWKSHLPI